MIWSINRFCWFMTSYCRFTHIQYAMCAVHYYFTILVIGKRKHMATEKKLSIFG